jgi:uncharacterized protein
MKERQSDPHAVPVARCCRQGDSLSGSTPTGRWQRLATSLHEAPAADASTAWQATFGQHQGLAGPPDLWLALQARAHVRLQCQRCLGMLEEVLEVERRFRFVASEAEAERLDAEAGSDSDDEHLVLPARLDVLELIEDELILALPLVPRHAGDCPQPLAAARPAADGAATDDADPPERRNPFAALAALRQRGGQG